MRAGFAGPVMTVSPPLFDFPTPKAPESQSRSEHLPCPGYRRQKYFFDRAPGLFIILIIAYLWSQCLAGVQRIKLKQSDNARSAYQDKKLLMVGLIVGLLVYPSAFLSGPTADPIIRRTSNSPSDLRADISDRAVT